MKATDWLMASGKVQAVLIDDEGTTVILKPGWLPPALFAIHPRDLALPLSEAIPTGDVVGFTATAPCTSPTTPTPRRFRGRIIEQAGQWVKFQTFKPNVKRRWYLRNDLTDFTPPNP